MIDSPKPWYTSKTIWAGYIAMVLPILNLASVQFHFTLPDQQIIVDTLTAAGTVVAGVMAVVGRYKATATIGAK